MGDPSSIPCPVCGRPLSACTWRPGSISLLECADGCGSYRYHHRHHLLRRCPLTGARQSVVTGPSLDPNDTVLWTVGSGDGRSLTCVVRFVSYAGEFGVEVELSIDRNPLVSQVFTTGTDALQWAAEQRSIFDGVS